MDDKIPDGQMRQFCGFLAETTGLTFPLSRWPDLRRAIAATEKELGPGGWSACARAMLGGPAATRELESLINHLTVGETYFFRERRCFEILENQILPTLVRARKNGRRQLRIWSAACCTGEEAYSIAIILRHAIPDWQDWDITLLATDINSRYLRKAKAGVFGLWSFRDVPPWLLGRYFRRVSDGHFEILPEIKRMVRFSRLNLVEDAYPSIQNDTNAMDVIFCRNVLMYFSAPQGQRVINKLYRAQADKGWLVVGPSELPSASCQPYLAANYQGTILHQKGGQPPAPEPELIAAAEPAVEPMETVPEPAQFMLPPLAVEQPIQSVAAESPSPAELNHLAISLADQGRLAEALNCCDQWIAADRLNSAGHYLRAVILQEQGEIDQAVGSLRKALFLEPNHLPTHFALGNIARNRGHSREAVRHLKNAKKLLRYYQPNDPIPEFGGVTAGRFAQMIDSLLEMEAVP